MISDERIKELSNNITIAAQQVYSLGATNALTAIRESMRQTYGSDGSIPLEAFIEIADYAIERVNEYPTAVTLEEKDALTVSYGGEE